MTTPVEEVLTKGDEAQELWMPVEEFNGKYEVSNHGRVRSLQKGEPALMKLGKQRNIVVACCVTAAPHIAAGWIAWCWKLSSVLLLVRASARPIRTTT